MKILALALLFVAVYAKHEEYIGWKSYYVTPTTQEELKYLGSLDGDYELDFISYATINREGLVLVKPRHIEGFEKALENGGIQYKLHSDDIKGALDLEDVMLRQRSEESRSRNGGRNIPYDNYQTWEVIDQYIQDIAARYPDRVTLVTPANSFEGRPIRYLKISSTNFQDTNKPVIFIDGGIHAREWISPPSVTWIINKLVEDVTEPELLDQFDFILLPVVNPDGYSFTFTNSRFWRKTRSTDQHVLSSLCPGVDGNRNYDFFWGSVGSSTNPCDDTYAGGSPFSEIETRVVRDVILENLDRLALYITIHSYGSMILYPWGHNGQLSENSFNLHIAGVDMAQAIEAAANPSFPRYSVGNSVLVIGYGASGAAEDYAHLTGVPLAYTIELPGFGFGLNGFALDPIWIPQVVRETWDGVKAGARRAGTLWRQSRQDS